MFDSLELPSDWKAPDDNAFGDSLELAITALREADVELYYSPQSNYAGSTFSNLGVNEPYSISADDLHAVSMLSVNIGPRGTRRLVEEGPFRDRVVQALHKIPADTALRECSGDDLVAAWELYSAIKDAIRVGPSGKGPWVTASKLAARKRPNLIPVRDNVVARALHPGALESASVYWQVMRLLLSHERVSAALQQRRDALEQEARISVDESDLRLLDVALWMYLARGTRADHSEENPE